MTPPRGFKCAIRMPEVDGLTASKLLDALLSHVELHGEQHLRFPDVHEHTVIASDGDGDVGVQFVLHPGVPRTGTVGAAIRASSILTMAAESVVGMAPRVTYIEVTAL